MITGGRDKVEQIYPFKEGVLSHLSHFHLIRLFPRLLSYFNVSKYLRF